MATLVTIPEIGYGMNQAIIVEWYKKEGDDVIEGEPLLTIETEKASNEITSPASGILKLIKVNTSTMVIPGQVVAIIANMDENIDDVPNFSLGENREKQGYVQLPDKALRIRATPAAKRIAEESKFDLANVVGTGPEGRITKEDVLKSLEMSKEHQTSERMTSFEGQEVIPLTSTRKAIIERLTISKQTVADVTTFAEVDVSELVEIRKQIPASFTSLVVKAAAEAIKSFPVICSSLIEDNIVVKKQINIGVALETERGLLVPVIRDVDKKSLLTISNEIDELSERAKKGPLGVQEFKGGTFTVTNSGAFGSLFFTPIINYPEVAVLGVGKAFETPLIRSHQVVIGWMIYLCLTYDHRVIDGAYAVRFLQQVKRCLENPRALIQSQSL